MQTAFAFAKAEHRIQLRQFTLQTDCSVRENRTYRRAGTCVDHALHRNGRGGPDGDWRTERCGGPTCSEVRTYRWVAILWPPALTSPGTRRWRSLGDETDQTIAVRRHGWRALNQRSAPQLRRPSALTSTKRALLDLTVRPQAVRACTQFVYAIPLHHSSTQLADFTTICSLSGPEESAVKKASSDKPTGFIVIISDVVIEAEVWRLGPGTLVTAEVHSCWVCCAIA